MIQNRKAHFDYHIIKEYTAGLILKGSEVKSLRFGNANISEAFLYEKNGEIWITNMWIDKYTQAFYTNHDERRERKLLLNKKEILEIKSEVESGGLTLIPLKVLTINNKFKLIFGIAKGKKNWDKRNTIKSRDIERDIRNYENY